MTKVATKSVPNKVKATIVECKNHKSGSLLICELPDGSETAVFVNVPDFVPQSINVELTRDGDYWRYRQVITKESIFDLAKKFGVVLKA